MKLEGKQASPKSGNETFGCDIVKENNQKAIKVEEEDYVDRFLYQTKNDRAANVVDSRRDYSNDDLPDNSEVELRRFVDPLQNEERASIEREEHEMPEVTICYEEDESSHVVKDICVDEGVPVNDKFLFDTSTMDDYLSTFLPPGKVIKGQDVDKEPVVDVIPDQPVVSKISEEKGPEDTEKIHSTQIEEEKVEPLANSGSNALKRSQSLGDLLALPEPSTDSNRLEPLSSQTSGSIRRHMPDDNPDLSATSTSHEERENDSKGPSLSTNSIASTSKEPSDARNHDQIPGTPATVQEGAEAERHSMDSMSDDLTNEVAGRLSFENRVSNATAAAAADDIKLPPPNNVKPHLLTSSIAGTESEPTSNRIRYEAGDSSFSVVATEPVPFSGSISMRSDSSTTSARSFAFPVLQSEWNSSPVRMAKADRKRLRKHRRWSNGILCCKF